MSVEVTIDQFQGPLDLLLNMITSQKIDILDIPIARITDQYNEIIRSWKVYDMQEASDYIAMAARLLEIKSKMLLPKRKKEVPEEDPREELAAQLAQYAVYKKIAEYLEALEAESSKAYSKDPEYIAPSTPQPPPVVSLDKLERAMRRMLVGLEARRVTVPGDGDEGYSVGERREAILRLLALHPLISLRGVLSETPSVDEVITTFLAVLELYKVGEVDFTQEENEIHLSKRTGAAAGAGRGGERH